MSRKNYKHKWYKEHKKNIKNNQYIKHCSYNHLVHIGKIIKNRLSQSGNINSYTDYYDDINDIPREK